MKVLARALWLALEFLAVLVLALLLGLLGYGNRKDR